MALKKERRQVNLKILRIKKSEIYGWNKKKGDKIGMEPLTLEGASVQYQEGAQTTIQWNLVRVNTLKMKFRLQ